MIYTQTNTNDLNSIPGKLQIARYLTVKYGANIKAKDNKGRTAHDLGN